jgi:hypothetical protein
MTKFKVFKADVWPDCEGYSINMYYPLINTYSGYQLIIELSDEASDNDIINELNEQGIIDIIDTDNYTIDIDYMYNDIIITISDNNDIEQLPIIIKLEELQS